MKNQLIALIALAAPVAASAQIQLVAGWDFGGFTFDGFAYTDPDLSDFATSIDANFSSVGQFNPVTSHNGNTPVSAGTGSIGWAYSAAENGQLFSAAGTRTVNTTMVDFVGTPMSNNNSDPTNKALAFTDFNGGSISLNVNLSGYQDFDPVDHAGAANLSFAASAEGAISLEWVFNGSTFATTNLAPGTLSNFGTYTVDIPANFYGSSSSLTVNVTGADTFRIDNLQINGVVGSAIPEPSSFAALAGLVGIGFAASRRRAVRA